MRGSLPWVVLVVLLFFAYGVTAESPVPPDDQRLLILARHGVGQELGGEDRAFIDYLVRAVTGAFQEKGLRAVEAVGEAEFGFTPGTSEPALVRTVGAARGVRWVVVVGIDLQPRRLSWRIAAYDTLSGGMLASDAYSAYPGLSALTLIEDSAAKLSRRWMRAAREGDTRRELVPFSQRFRSVDDGVSLRFGSASGPYLDAGTSKGGTLEAAYFPFTVGDPVHLELHREGFWPRSLILPEGITEEPVRLPRLQRRAGHAWGPSIGVGRLLGAGASYRWQPLPDRLYLRAENALWLNSDFRPGSSVVLHNELRLGLGVYLQRNRDARFRVSAGLGTSGIGTLLTDAPGYDSAAILDLVLEPLFLTFEYHWPSWALVLEQRVPYALGTGALTQGWMDLENMGPPFLSLGVLFKW